jgi:UrcA family protein
MTTTILAKPCNVLLCAFCAAALCTLSMPGEAMTGDPATSTVRFADLDITKPAGAKALYGRIRAAAQEVCHLSYSRDLLLRQVEHSCIEAAIDTAVKTINAPALSALRFGSDIRLASK